jgi:hypothetical protein
MKYIFLFILISISKTTSFITNSLIKASSPVRLREYIKKETEKNFKHITYPKAKDILHKNIGEIDIYGDGTLEKNVEHIFPQFKFKGKSNKSVLKSDMHNLYLCNSRLNNLRQNFKYIDSASVSLDDKIKILDRKGCEVNTHRDIFTKTGYLMVSNRKQKTFIPTNYSRGKISRALSYFTIKYDFMDELEDIIDFKTLIEWNLKDPVDNDEYLKNIKIYKYQGNINPFIMEPDLVQYCFSDKFEVSDETIKKKRGSFIDPLYTIDYLINEINILEKQKITNDKMINKLSKLSKRDY